MRFDELNLSDGLVRALEKIGLDTATPIQEQTIPRTLAGVDLIGKSVTGSGKTFAYGLPLIDRLDAEDDAVQGLIVCPTRELAEQVATELRKVTNSLDRVKVLLLCGGMDMRKQINALKDAVKIVVGTPGRLVDHLKRRTLKTASVRTVVLDEADEMLKMGFRDELSAILEALPKTRQTLMFSATMPDGVETLAKKYMRSPETVEIGSRVSTVDRIRQGYVFCKNADKNATLIAALKAADTDKCLVFCNTRNTVEQLADALRAARINVRALHGQMQQSERRRAMDAARSYDGAVLVATDVAARGIDINDVEYVFNYDIPHELEYYIHRIGRTARAGKAGTAITIVTTRLQQEKLRGYADEAHSVLCAMGIRDGKLVELDGPTDEFEAKRSRASEEGNLAALEELERSREKFADKQRGDDRLLENMLRMLRRKPDNADVIEQLHTFGFSDDELLSAALALYAESRGALDRSHADREKKRGFRSDGKKPSGKKPPFSQKPPFRGKKR